MAEFCLECWCGSKEIQDKKKYILSKQPCLCEGCGEVKLVVITDRKYYYRRKFRHVIIPITILCKLVCLPYLIYEFIKTYKAQKAYYEALERQKVVKEQEMEAVFERLLQEALEEYGFNE